MAPQTRINDIHYNKYTVYEAKINNKIVYRMTGFSFSLISLGIVAIVPSGEIQDSHYAKIGDRIRILIYFNGKLSVEPTVRIGNKEFNASYRPLSSNPEKNSYAYYADCTLTSDLNLSEGIIQFEIYGYKDDNGKEGNILTNEDISNSTYNYVIFDDIPPTASIKAGEQFTIGNDIDGYKKISFQLHDNIALRGYILNEKTTILTPSQWSDANNITISTSGAILGNNIITIVDMAGNKNKYEFKLVES